MLVKLIFLLSLTAREIAGLGEVIFALNAGGESFTDSHGIRYRRDYLSSGVASDYGKSLLIRRVPEQDRLLYQTERYSTETFAYNIPMPSESADYVLWLKFSEVWFNAPNQKVFDIALNDIVVVKDLDIFAKVGRGVAHDEIIPFRIKQNKLIVGDQSIPFNNEVTVEFIKTDKDNPKINAIVIIKGTPDQVPQLEPYEPPKRNYDQLEDEEDSEREPRDVEDEEQDDDLSEQELLRRKMKMMQEQNEQEEEENNRIKRKSPSSVKLEEAKAEDPYSSDETSYLIPILVSVGALIPLLFCLCKL